jgi:hypothetical protein
MRLLLKLAVLPTLLALLLVPTVLLRPIWRLISISMLLLTPLVLLLRTLVPLLVSIKRFRMVSGLLSGLLLTTLLKLPLAPTLLMMPLLICIMLP